MRHSRKAKRPSEQSQRGVRRPLGQSRAPAAPRKNTRLSQTQFLISFCLPNHTINSTDQVTTTSLRSSIALSPSLLPAWGLRAAQNPQGIPRAIASKPVPAEIICRWPRRLGEVAGRRSSLALVGCRRVFVDPSKAFVFFNAICVLHSSIGDPKLYVSRNSIKFDFYLFHQLQAVRKFLFFADTGPTNCIPITMAMK